jgi:hypothetical protein
MAGVDRTASIFGNRMDDKVIRKADNTKAKLAKKFRHDEKAVYAISAEPCPRLGDVMGVKNLRLDPSGEPIDAKNGVVVGTIRMGYGHYRIAMAIASAARSMGLTPYWFDLMSYPSTTCSKVIAHLNGLYSFGSRLSQRFELFNRWYWEPLNYEGFKKLSFNANDQRMTELFAPVCRPLPPNIPFFGSHVWPAQAAVHAGLTNVVNIIPDNWPMGLHLAEGTLHCVQSPSAYMGYRTLREMNGADKVCLPIPAEEIKMVGHFIDHEFLVNLEADCQRRVTRVKGGKPRRILMSVGGAGAQREFMATLLRTALKKVEEGRATLFLNLGDHKGVLDYLLKEVPELASAVRHVNDWNESTAFIDAARDGDLRAGCHIFLNDDIYSAVYVTNLLMRISDVLITKPSELAYYPVPKLFIKRVGGHEMWGAIRGAELGDGTIECANLDYACQALNLMVGQDDLLMMQINSILRQFRMGTYNGAYEAVRFAQERRV